MKRKLLLALAGSLFEARDAAEALMNGDDPADQARFSLIRDQLSADARVTVAELEQEISGNYIHDSRG